MRQRILGILPAIALMACTIILPALPARAQAPVTLQEQLAAQYKVTKMGSDTSGYSVVDAGTLLAIQKGGILAVPYSDSTILTTKFEGGAVHSPNSLLTKGLGFGMKKFGQEQTTHLFQVGDKVYATKLEVNLAKDQVLMGIVACDTCTNTNPPTYNKAIVAFQFPKGSLAKAGIGEVEDTIGQLFTISDDQQGQGGQGQGDQGQQQQGQQQQQQAPAQAQAPQAEPQTIDKGQTSDQVEQALGKPDKIVKLGTKQIWVYKDLKVTFLNGKVSDVE